MIYRNNGWYERAHVGATFPEFERETIQILSECAKRPKINEKVAGLDAKQVNAIQHIFYSMMEDINDLKQELANKDRALAHYQAQASPITQDQIEEIEMDGDASYERFDFREEYTRQASEIKDIPLDDLSLKCAAGVKQALVIKEKIENKIVEKQKDPEPVLETLSAPLPPALPKPVEKINSESEKNLPNPPLAPTYQAPTMPFFKPLVITSSSLPPPAIPKKLGIKILRPANNISFDVKTYSVPIINDE
jgi:hypothetical protein